MAEAQQEFQDDVLTLATGPHLIVAVWRDAPQVAHMEPLRGAQASLLRRLSNERFVFANVIVSGTPSFDNEVRRQLAEIVGEYGKQSLGQANLVLLEGLAGTATRAFISTLNLVSRTAAPSKVFKGRAELERWALERIRAHDATASRIDVSATMDAAGVP